MNKPSNIVLGGDDFWAELNRLFYEKYPELRRLDCGVCQAAYCDFPSCPVCGYLRAVQLRTARWLWLKRAICWIKGHVRFYDLSDCPDCYRCGHSIR